MFTSDEIRYLAEVDALISRALACGETDDTESELRRELPALHNPSVGEHAAADAAALTVEKVIGHIHRLLFSPSGMGAAAEAIQSDTRLSELCDAILSIRRLAVALSDGDLSEDVSVKGFVASVLKSLQANLRHLTWQTKQIAAGDYSQRVDFMGEFATAFNTMTAKLRETVGALQDKQNELRKMIAALDKEIEEHKEALARVRQLHGLLPICAYCKKIRDDQNYWLQVESYISKHAEVRFSHGICPDCYKVVAREWKLEERPRE